MPISKSMQLALESCHLFTKIGIIVPESDEMLFSETQKKEIASNPTMRLHYKAQLESKYDVDNKLISHIVRNAIYNLAQLENPITTDLDQAKFAISAQLLNGIKRYEFLKQHFPRFNSHYSTSVEGRKMIKAYEQLQEHIFQNKLRKQRIATERALQESANIKLSQMQLKQEQTNLSMQNLQLQKQLNQLDQTNVALLQEKQQIQTQLIEEKASHANLRTEKDSLREQSQKTLKEKDQKLAKLTEELEQANAVNEKVQTKIKEHDKCIHRLEISNEELQTKVRALEEALEIQTREQRAFDQEDGYSSSTSSYSFNSDTESDVEPGSSSPISESDNSDDDKLSDDLNKFYCTVDKASK